jgi:hypothetical protein
MATGRSDIAALLERYKDYPEIVAFIQQEIDTAEQQARMDALDVAQSGPEAKPPPPIGQTKPFTQVSMGDYENMAMAGMAPNLLQMSLPLSPQLRQQLRVGDRKKRGSLFGMPIQYS